MRSILSISNIIRNKLIKESFSFSANIHTKSKIPISETIRNRLKNGSFPFLANDNIAAHLLPGEMEALEIEVKDRVQDLLNSMIIDTENDHNTHETAKRISHMYLHEIFKGRYQPPPKITDFPNAKKFNDIYTVGPITVRSTCSHHLVPITGHCWIGVKPGDRVIGLSKFNRLVDWIMARPQIQEEAVVMLADTIENIIKPQGLAVVLKAQHNCMSWRGVKDNNTNMITSVIRGSFRDDAKSNQELMEILKGQGF
jgi:GTP cyclohydrolase I